MKNAMSAGTASVPQHTMRTELDRLHQNIGEATELAARIGLHADTMGGLMPATGDVSAVPQESDSLLSGLALANESLARALAHGQDELTRAMNAVG